MGSKDEKNPTLQGTPESRGNRTHPVYRAARGWNVRIKEVDSINHCSTSNAVEPPPIPRVTVTALPMDKYSDSKNNLGISFCLTLLVRLHILKVSFYLQARWFTKFTMKQHLLIKIRHKG